MPVTMKWPANTALPVMTHSLHVCIHTHTVAKDNLRSYYKHTVAESLIIIHFICTSSIADHTHAWICNW